MIGAAGRACVTLHHLDVRERSIADHGLGERDCIVAALDADHRAVTADARREQSNTALGTATDFDDSCAGTDPDAIEEPIRLVSKLLRLFLQALLLRLAIAQQVLVRFRHATPRKSA